MAQASAQRVLDIIAGTTRRLYQQTFRLWPTDSMPVDRILAITGGKRVAIMGKLEKKIPV